MPAWVVTDTKEFDDASLVIAVALATAANIIRLDAQHIEFQPDADAADRAVHVVPSGEVMTLLVPLSETAVNTPSSGDQQTDCH